MDAALGPPEQMAAHRDELTPMMAQYFDLCERYDDALVLFQVGDFYEAFCDAAERVSRLLEITLTKREDSTGSYAMAGIPVDNAESYIERLLDAGYRVAVADQVQDPDEATGVVDRAVTRIVTPGTLTEDELLGGADNNFVACLARDDEPAGYGLAVLDVSTGDFLATGAGSAEAIADEVSRFDPAEAIVEPGGPAELFGGRCMVTPYEASAFDLDDARARVTDYFGPPEDVLATPAEIRACGALLAYAEYTRGGETGRLEYLTQLRRYDPREYLLLDAVALRSLEVFERRSIGGVAGATLAGVVDETVCALGSRRLTDWLRRPLVEPDRIEARLDAVEELTGDVQRRERLRERLREVYDLERLISRVSRGRADARDLQALAATLSVVPDLREATVDVEAERLVSIRGRLDDIPETRELIGRAIREDPPTEITEGGVIAPGYSEELDELRETERAGEAWIDQLEASERERTGIDSLKVGYNAVHGYYIEVTDPNLDRVPDDYTRRQTLKNAERFYTPGLKRREDEIVRARSQADGLELRLFREVRSTVATVTTRVQALADALAELDALCSLAEVAARYDYTRPEIDGDGIVIRGGRHPVVERTRESFVPNDTELVGRRRLAVITGPNMSGKSTYMRQVALIVILAQAGSFVPAAAARISPADRVFTRVGASDDLAGGRSTFMVEMTELAEILDEATDRSLVLLDEVGRGTSTADGLALARAITEYVHDEVGSVTLFATHHHELTAVADELPGALNLHFDADSDGEEVTFRHDIAPGAAGASYGIEVAGMAGVPDRVVRRARQLVGGVPDAAGGRQDRSALKATLAGIDIGETTPLEALNVLARLKRLVEE